MALFVRETSESCMVHICIECSSLCQREFQIISLRTHNNWIGSKTLFFNHFNDQKRYKFSLTTKLLNVIKCCVKQDEKTNLSSSVQKNVELTKAAYI